MAKPIKKKSEKKKKFRGYKRKCIREQKEQFPATDINIEALIKKIKAKCFNCNNKSHYINNCIEPKN